MRVRIKQVGETQPEEVVVYCRKITSEVEAIVQRIGQLEKTRTLPAFFKGEEQYFLNLSEILFFETDAERVFAHTANDSFETRSRLYELEASLPGNFIRVSRSTIVNILQIYSIQRGLTRVNLISFRKSHKAIYSSRMFNNALIQKMEERAFYENF